MPLTIPQDFASATYYQDNKLLNFADSLKKIASFALGQFLFFVDTAKLIGLLSVQNGERAYKEKILGCLFQNPRFLSRHPDIQIKFLETAVNLNWNVEKVTNLIIGLNKTDQLFNDHFIQNSTSKLEYLKGLIREGNLARFQKLYLSTLDPAEKKELLETALDQWKASKEPMQKKYVEFFKFLLSEQKITNTDSIIQQINVKQDANQNTLMGYAIKNQNLNLIRSLKELGVELNKTVYFEEALKTKNLDLLEIFDLNHISINSVKENEKILKKLIKNNCAIPQIFKEKILIQACREGANKLISLLLKDAKISQNSSLIDQADDWAIHFKNKNAQKKLEPFKTKLKVESTNTTKEATDTLGNSLSNYKK